MVVDGARRSGTTNGDGELVEKVPALARELQLFLGEGEQRTEYKVLLGALDPAETISGAQARLTNLGFDPGDAMASWARARARRYATSRSSSISTPPASSMTRPPPA